MSDGLKFFGCTVKNFSTSLGWGTQPSTVRVSIVQDVVGGDQFNPLPIGTPATVQYGSLYFTGLVRDWKRLDSSDGFPVYDVNLEDPRSILDGTELILKDYAGTTEGVPNLLNIYGYNENIGFGNALTNESGMPWFLIAQTIQTLVDGVLAGIITPYGQSLSYKGVLYGIDLTEMPAVPTYYRLPGINISLLRAIEQVCTDAACEFFIDFIPGTTIIRVRTVNRRLPPSLSVLSNFIDQQTLSGLCISSSKGLEMRNEPTSAFITGGLISTLYESTVNYQYFGQNILNQPIVTYYQNPVNTLQTATASGISLSPTSIILSAGASAVDDYYVGAYIIITSGTGAGQRRFITDYDGTTKIAAIDEAWETTPDATSVYKIYTLLDPYGLKADLNCSEVADILGTNTYTCFISEMLCALKGINAWETYIQANRTDLAFLFEGWRLPIAQQVGALTRGQLPIDTVNLRRDFAVFEGSNLIDANTGRWKKERVYAWFISTVNNHLGKTFLANIPFMYSAFESDTNILRLSHEPTNAGWIEGGPPGIPLEKQDLFATEDGRTLPHAKYIQTQTVVARGNGLGDSFPNEVHLSEPASNVDNAYVGYKVEITSGTGVGQISTIETFTGSTKIATVTPWVGVQPDTTSVIIVYKTVLGIDLTKMNRRRDAFISGRNVFVKAQVEQGKVYMINGITPCALVTLSDALWEFPSSCFGSDLSALAILLGHSEASIIDMSRRMAGGRISWDISPPAVSPFSIQIPLQSNTLTYGPWYAIGAQGKVSFRSDSSLTPWNYGGSSIMNLTAEAMVQDAISWANVVETGEVQLVGAPVMSLGDALLVKGPVCTGMDVYYGEDGIKTNYRFQTYSPKFGVFSMQNVQRLKTIGLANQRISREIRTTLHELRSTGTGISETVAYAHRTWQENQGFWSGHSTHPVITCDSVIDSRDDTKRRVECALVPLGEMTHGWAADDDGANSEFTSKAAVSLSGLFRPFNTRLVGVDGDGDAINLPDGIAEYDEMQMPAYWNSESMANYTYAMTVFGDNSIDPFIDGGDFEVMLQGTEYSDAHYNISGSTGQNDQRTVCLRGPLVISGWGRCTDDAWVPNENPDTLDGDIIAGYNQKSHLWKTGPLEILWDDERGVWTGMGMCMGKTVGICAANGGTTTLNLYENATTAITGRKKARTVYNFMSSAVPANTKVICMYIPEKNGWVICAADCS